MTTDTETHSHRWRIPTGISPQVGVCACGESRLFATNFEDSLKANAKGKPMHQAGTPVRGMADAGFVTPWEPGLLR